MRTLPPGHDVLLYDGACRLCQRAVVGIVHVVPGTTATDSFREAGVLRRYPPLEVTMCESAIQLVRSDGMIFAGIEALVQALRERWYGPLLRMYYVPGVHQLADAVYGSIARRRFDLTLAHRRASRGGVRAAPPRAGAAG